MRKTTNSLSFFYLTFIFLFLSISVSSQNFSGRVLDSSSEPVPYASIYLKELMRGFTADESGTFHTTLAPGNYTYEVSSMGYRPQSLQVTITNAAAPSLTIILEEQVYALKEVRINKKAEDPAYAVMRQTIAAAPFNLNRITGYTSEMYLKGSGKMDKIPAVLKLSKKVRSSAQKYMNRLFLLEEQREVVFQAPDHWQTNVVAYSNTFPDEVRVEIGLSMLNFYKPQLFGRISPINPSAFSYYRFKLDGCYVEGDKLINKIRVIPKNDSPQLFSGHLYIVENTWNVSAANLKMSLSGVDMRVQVICTEVVPDVYLPTSISAENKFNIMGFKAEAAYLASVQYLDVDVAQQNITLYDVTPSDSLTATPLDRKQQKRLDKIEQLLAKEELTMNDAYRLYKLREEVALANDTLRTSHRFERLSIDQSTHLTTDSLAVHRDSTYWKDVRTVQLKPEEIESYAFRKEMDNIVDSLSSRVGAKKSIYGTLLSTAILGNRFNFNKDRMWLQFYNLLSYMPSSNFVDGTWLGAKVDVGFKLTDEMSLLLMPSLYYTTKRKVITGEEAVQLNYAPRRMGQLKVAVGTTSADYNGTCGEGRLINSIASSLFGRNDLKLYDKRYLLVRNQVELANSLLFSAELTWQKRKMLENLQHKGLFGHEATPNYPDVSTFSPMPSNELLRMTLGLEWTPAHYYKMKDGEKVYEPSSYPSLAIQYQKAFPLHRATVSPSFQMASVSAWQNVEFGLFNQICWSANAGMFWDKKNVQFPDFKHFEMTKLPVTQHSFDSNFSLMGNYAYSTDSKWVQAHFSWYTPYMFLKYIPFLKKQLFDEALHFRTVAVHQFKPYSEVGYSVGLPRMLRVGVFVGFKSFNYDRVGVSVSLPIVNVVEHIKH